MFAPVMRVSVIGEFAIFCLGVEDWTKAVRHVASTAVPYRLTEGEVLAAATGQSPPHQGKIREMATAGELAS